MLFLARRSWRCSSCTSRDRDVTFDDGTTARVAYAGQNGRRYAAIGRTLIAQHQLTKDKTSLQTIRAWLLWRILPKRAR